ncbi:MAG: DUF951 domain-containing protein [Clostridia bacterium]|nr:DUF951 domain-containing protein [Clostridia bacterium]MBQ2327146.1 DUF951 domain-containing protein [Clostridia bacterium]MBQ5814071.1 DUF951 domain-containing protein [Clostridia bacterium]
MDIHVGDTLVMKKPHPCGQHNFVVLRVGMDFRLRCCGCSHEFIIPRVKAEKNIKQLIKSEENGD